MLVEVHIVRGDFGNMGRGKILGEFESKELAKQNATGCGSFDCGGDGLVETAYAIKLDSGYYVLENPNAYQLNQMTQSLAKDIYARYNVILQSSTDSIAVIKELRTSLEFTIQKAATITRELPYLLATGMWLYAAEALAKRYRSLGATVLIVKSS